MTTIVTQNLIEVTLETQEIVVEFPAGVSIYTPTAHTHSMSEVSGLTGVIDDLENNKQNKDELNQPLGYAGLDSTGKIYASLLPSFVDDVIECATYSAMTSSAGESGKIYVVLGGAEQNKTYRWSGSVYVEISASPGSTDAVVEGATNLYFTVGRVLGTVLNGLSTATNAVITASDTILGALGKLQAQITALDGSVVKTSGNQTISNIKTFTSFPITPSSAPTTDYQVANKKYVDDNGGGPTTSSTKTADYTLALGDAQTLVYMNKSTAVTLTIPTNASVAFPVDTQIDVVSYGAGDVSIAGASGVTINSLSGNKKINGQYVGVTLKKVATDTWILIGNLKA